MIALFHASSVVARSSDCEVIHFSIVDGLERGGELHPEVRVQAVERVGPVQDHVGAAAELRETTDVAITGPHKEDAFWLDMLPQQSQMFGFPPAGHFTPTRWLADGDTVQIGHCTLAVRHCPGHTPGHVVFHSPEAQRAFVGDVLFAGSIGRTDFPGGNHAQLLASIRERLWPMGDETVFIPGHGPEGRFGQERRSNPFVGERA